MEHVFWNRIFLFYVAIGVVVVIIVTVDTSKGGVIELDADLVFRFFFGRLFISYYVVIIADVQVEIGFCRIGSGFFFQILGMLLWSCQVVFVKFDLSSGPFSYQVVFVKLFLDRLR